MSKSSFSDTAKNFIKSVGNTPLVKISDNLYGKLETANPTGSVKDRMISYVVQCAVKSGEIKPTTLLVEATSGNTGIALSALGAAMGNKVQIVMPCNMSEERKQMMRAFGASILEVAASDFDAAIQKRNEILACVDDSWSPCQFENDDNIKCHMHKTAPEIYDQIPGSVPWSGFVSGVGTGGTINDLGKLTASGKASFADGQWKISGRVSNSRPVGNWTGRLSVGIHIDGSNKGINIPISSAQIEGEEVMPESGSVVFSTSKNGATFEVVTDPDTEYSPILEFSQIWMNAVLVEGVDND